MVLSLLDLLCIILVNLVKSVAFSRGLMVLNLLDRPQEFPLSLVESISSRVPKRPPRRVFLRRADETRPAAPPRAQIAPDWGKTESGDPKPNPARWGSLGGAG